MLQSSCCTWCEMLISMLSLVITGHLWWRAVHCSFRGNWQVLGMAIPIGYTQSNKCGLTSLLHGPTWIDRLITQQCVGWPVEILKCEQEVKPASSVLPSLMPATCNRDLRGTVLLGVSASHIPGIVWRPRLPPDEGYQEVIGGPMLAH